jgi:capsular polysaccharide biosynthesis protein
VAEVTDVIVPGHRVTPVDPVTGNQIASDFFGAANYSTARPSISALTRYRMSDDYTIVIPRMDHFGHLLTDWILPAFFAVQQAGLKAGDHLNVVTSDHPVSLIIAFVEALRHAGFLVTHRQSRLTETIVVPRLLYANCHTNSIYHRFCTPEVLVFAREHLLAVLPPITRTLPKRIYLDRGRTRVRHVEHEERLVALLEAQGFERFTGRWSNLAEQIAIFSQVETVVGIHSGGMANMLWSGPQALFVEITAEDARETTALHWCSAVGARYRMLLGSPERELQNFTIDADTIFASIMAEMAVHQGSRA